MKDRKEKMKEASLFLKKTFDLKKCKTIRKYVWTLDLLIQGKTYEFVGDVMDCSRQAVLI